jgi:predicted GNAT family acetyltransferase
MEYNIEHISKLNRFECQVSGYVAYAEYTLENRVINITKTYVPTPIAGQGIAGQIMQAIFEYAYKHGYNIKGTCTYAAAWLKKQKLSMNSF